MTAQPTPNNSVNPTNPGTLLSGKPSRPDDTGTIIRNLQARVKALENLVPGQIVPSAFIGMSTAFPVPTGVMTPIVWDNLYLGVGGMILSAAGGKVPRSGMYHCSFGSTWNSFAAPANNRQWAITKGGAAFVQAGTTDPASQDAHMEINATIPANAGDIISVSILQTSGATNNLASLPWTWLSIDWVGLFS